MNKKKAEGCQFAYRLADLKFALLQQQKLFRSRKSDEILCDASHVLEQMNM